MQGSQSLTGDGVDIVVAQAQILQILCESNWNYVLRFISILT